MKIAVPTEDGMLCEHFGRCEEFAFFDVDEASGNIINSETVPAPEHEPGLLPRWLKDLSVDVVIVGGIGPRAEALLAQNRIHVIAGAKRLPPEGLVRSYLEGSLQREQNICDH
ncbi:MAG: NifB/NifX family molybdenum-iron cluster-binding protein [Armatimonadota bacterium]|nr:NifB/NifX family molybdenum-iron cluster-binding protein [Armatimonadota bacterium]